MFETMDELVEEFFGNDYMKPKDEEIDLETIEWIDHLQRKENHNDGSVVAFTADDMFD